MLSSQISAHGRRFLCGGICLVLFLIFCTVLCDLGLCNNEFLCCVFLFIQEEASTIKAAGKAWYQTMISDSDYTEFDNFTKWLGVSQ